MVVRGRNVKSDIMRKIDYYVGIPLCFLFSLVHVVSKIFLKKDRAVSKPSRILFVKFFGMGTIILSTPAIKRCRELYPDAEIHFLTFDENRVLFDVVNVLAPIRVITIRITNIRYFVPDVFRAIFLVWRLRFDVVIDLEFFARFVAIISFLSRARSRVGFYNYFTEGLYRGNFLTHKAYYNHYQHTALAFLDMVETVKSGKSLPYNKMHCQSLPMLAELGITYLATMEEKIACREKFCLKDNETLILLNPNTSAVFCDLRRWPHSHFAELGRRILASCPHAVIGIVGAHSDLVQASELEKMIGSERVVNFAGRSTIGELCLLMDQALCLVTNDSGPSHLAALTGTKIIALFGPETPNLYSPLSAHAICMYLQLSCSPCWSVYNGKRSICRDNICLQNISPEMVCEEVIKELHHS